ncbi:MAG TPA: rhomboid family intramembrane serine protease [Planctomycetota bacterium]|jgi:membrane associated rhomboid family serine protease
METQRQSLCPVTMLLIIAACAVSMASFLGLDISAFHMHVRFWPFEPWRLATSALPHADALHLMFNLYWLWVFGSVVEGQLGPLKTLGIYLAFGVGSEAAEYALFQGGQGLSGIGYGLFGMLCVLSKHDPRFAGCMRPGTVTLFVIWFFLCIVATLNGYTAVGNVAHATGALMGLLLGYAMAIKDWRPGFSAMLCFPIVLVTLAGPLRPHVNLVGAAAFDFSYKGYEALLQNDNKVAAAFLDRSVAINPRDASTWYNLGVARQRLNQFDGALQAFQRAFDLDRKQPKHREMLAQFKSYKAFQEHTDHHLDEAIDLYIEALDLDDNQPTSWYNLALCYENRGKPEHAMHALEHAIILDNQPLFNAKMAKLKSAMPQEKVSVPRP